MKKPGGVTKIIDRSRQVKWWTPGSFVLLSLPRFGIGQSHPVTIASTPTSHGGDLVFFFQARHGFTRRIQAGYTRIDCLDSSINPEKERALSATTYLALIDGPYGGSHLDFAAFDTLVLIAGSTGVTFTLSILLDLVSRAQTQKLPLRKVTFIWAVKTEDCSHWISQDLQQAADGLHEVGH